MVREIENALTVDVEDYFHVAALSKVIGRSDWEKCEVRVERNTEEMLGIFENNGCKATFFLLGWVADRYPTLVKKIKDAGHEIASHGYSHKLIYQQTPEEFKQETIYAKKLLEDQSGQEVVGYRAASWSITKTSMWALDILIDAGFKWDSSIFPVHHDTYGIPGANRWPYKIATNTNASIIEFPPSTIRIGRLNVPVAGGGYFRLFPFWLSKGAIQFVNSKNKQPFMFYIHPWEIDPQQPRYKTSLKSSFRHYNNLGKCRSRLDLLTKMFKFNTVSSVLNDIDQFPAVAY